MKQAMSVRRKALAGVGVMAVAGALVGAGVALGSSSNRADSPGPDKSVVGSAGKSTKPLKCKAQACVLFNDDATILSSTNVTAVTNTGAGAYCIYLSSKLHPSSSTVVIGTPDYSDSPQIEILVQQSTAILNCPGGNAVRVLTWGWTGSNWSQENEAASVIVP